MEMLNSPINKGLPNPLHHSRVYTCVNKEVILMKKTNIQVLGLFPLNMVILPGEQARLHIFEPRYKQLINDCFARNADFGIPFFKDGKLQPFGVRVKLVDIEKFYPDGKMDIKIEGVSVFKVEAAMEMKNKLYSLGEIEEVYFEEKAQKKAQLMDLFYEYCMSTFNEDPSLSFDNNVGIFEIANALNLSTSQKFKLINSQDSNVMQNMLINHLNMFMALSRQEEDLNYKFFLN